MILDKGSYDKSRRLVEVYDDSQPAHGIEVTSIETLAARRRIVVPDIWTAHRIKNRRHMPEHLRPSTRQVSFRGAVEDDRASIWVNCCPRVACHASATYASVARQYSRA